MGYSNWDREAQLIVAEVARVNEEMIRESLDVEDEQDRQYIEDLIAEGIPDRPESFNYVVAQAGSRVLGVSWSDAERHPAVAQACLLLGRPAPTEVWAMQFGADSPMAQVVEPEMLGLPGPYRPAPQDPPHVLTAPMRLVQGEATADVLGFDRVTHLYGHPRLRPRMRNLTLVFDTTGVGVYERRHDDRVADLEWGKIRTLSVEGPEVPESRVTIPRVAAGGLFAWAFKKERRRGYLVFSGGFGDVAFEVPGLTGLELRTRISVVSRWLDTAAFRTPAEKHTSTPS